MTGLLVVAPSRNGARFIDSSAEHMEHGPVSVALDRAVG